MPLPPMLGAQPGGGGSSLGALSFALPELSLGNIGKRTGKKKSSVVALEDDEDPREEAQMFQLLQQMQKVKQSKENKRKRGETAAKAKGVAAGVRRHASKRVEETKSSQDKLASSIRFTMDSLRAALQEEASLAASILEEQNEAMRAAVEALDEKYNRAAEVHTKVKLLGDCVSQHFHVVKAHVAAQVDGKITETEEVAQGIRNQPDNIMNIIGAGELN